MFRPSVTITSAHAARERASERAKVRPLHAFAIGVWEGGREGGGGGRNIASWLAWPVEKKPGWNYIDFSYFPM